MQFQNFYWDPLALGNQPGKEYSKINQLPIPNVASSSQSSSKCHKTLTHLHYKLYQHRRCSAWSHMMLKTIVYESQSKYNWYFNALVALSLDGLWCWPWFVLLLSSFTNCHDLSLNDVQLIYNGNLSTISFSSVSPSRLLPPVTLHPSPSASCKVWFNCWNVVVAKT